MKTTLIIAAVLMSIGSIPATAKTVDPANLKRVTDCMIWRTCQNTVLFRGYHPDPTRQLVFTDNGQRYTFHLNWIELTLSIWVRPEGTVGTEELSTFTDENIDGDIDFGVMGSARLTAVQRKHFYNTEMPPHCDSTGEAFQPYWNERYTEAISAAVRQLCPAPAR